MSRKFKELPQVRPLTGVVYLRVSSKEQVKNFSLDTQEQICRDYAERKKIAVLKVFREEGQSAKTANRTTLTALIEYIRNHKGKVGYVIITRVDRWSREVKDYFALKTHLDEANVAIVSATENIDDTDEGEFFETVFAGIAQLDNRVKSRKTKAGLQVRAASGYWSGNPPLGYVKCLDQLGKKNLKPDPIKAGFVRALFEDYATGAYNFPELAKKYSDKLKSNRKSIPLYPQRISQLLQNPVYIARVEKKEWNLSVQGKFPPLVSDELFYKVQRLINGHPESRKQPRSKFNDDFPLRGILCSFCGRNITGGWSKGKLGVKYAYYNCTNRQCPMRRVHKSIKKKNIEDDFSVFLKENAPTEKFLKALRVAVKIAYQSEMAGVIGQSKQANHQIEKLKSDKEEVVDLIIKEPDLRDELKARLIKMDGQIRELEALAKNSQLETCDMDMVMDFAVALIQNLHEDWKNLKAKQLRVLTKLFFPRNLTYNYPNIQTPELPIIYTLNRRFAMKKERDVPRARVELARPCGQWILSPSCITISPPGHSYN